MGESTFDRCMVAVLMPILVFMIVLIYTIIGLAAFKFALWAVQ